MKIAFTKKQQGVFDAERISQIVSLLEKKQCEVVQDLDYRKMSIVNTMVYIEGKPVNDLGAYFWHDTVDTMLWQADNYYLHVLETLGYTCPVINTAESVRIVNDKFLAHTALRREGVPVADFALVNVTDMPALQAAFESLGSSVVVKPRYGGWGSGIVKVDSFDDLRAVIEYAGSFLPGAAQQVFLEKYYENDVHAWVSLVVINNEVVFGYRKSGDLIHDWKVYDPDMKDGRGAQSVYVEPTDDMKHIALAAARAIGKDIIGFDCILTNTGYVIVDENGRPGLYQHCINEAGLDLNTKIVELILSKVTI